MKNILAIILILLSGSAEASTVKRYFQEAKFPNQALLNKQTILNPVAASSSYVAAAISGSVSAAVATVTTGLTSPDVARNVRIIPTATTGDVESCVITVSGTDIHGGSISENFTFAANASTEQVGSKAFKTVTSLSFPADCESGSFGAQWYIGIGEKLGLNRCMDYAGHSVFSTIDGAYESTRATVAASSSDVESNTADFNGTMDGSSDFEIFFVQNYGCAP